jgi:signal transduction histidine kinase
MIERNVRRISDLVLNLLTYSKERKPEVEACFPDEIVEEVCSLMESKAREHDIEIRKHLDSLIGEVYIDPKSIHRSMLNLISNAIDACIFDSAPKKQWQVNVNTELQKDHKIKFEVTDNGMGMDKDAQEKIFSTLFSTKGEKGTGLGLLVTEKIVKESGGELSVESELGKGTTFTMCLPYKNLPATGIS